MAAQHHRLIIVGSGPAGYTAAVYAARAALAPVLITGVEVGGQMTTTTEVDNWPGDDTGVMGPELMERMKRHAERFGTKLIHNHVDRVERGHEREVVDAAAVLKHRHAVGEDARFTIERHKSLIQQADEN